MKFTLTTTRYFYPQADRRKELEEIGFTFKPSDYKDFTIEGSPEIEINSLEWLNNPTYHNKYHGQIFASNAGYNYLIDETDHKVWIATRGVVVYINNRGRFFLNGLSAEEVVSCMDKAYITIGLGNVTMTEEGSGYTHQEGAYCYKDVDCLIAFTDFYASSDDQDTTIKDLIHKISALTGAKALFPGDTVIDSVTLNDGDSEDLL